MAPFITDCVQMQEEMGQNIDLPEKYFVSNVENAAMTRYQIPHWKRFDTELGCWDGEWIVFTGPHMSSLWLECVESVHVCCKHWQHVEEPANCEI